MNQQPFIILALLLCLMALCLSIPPPPKLEEFGSSASISKSLSADSDEYFETYETLAEDEEPKEAACTLSCKQVCSDCTNEATIYHFFKSNGVCATKQTLYSYDMDSQREVLQAAYRQCGKVCTKCTKLSSDVLDITRTWYQR